MSGTGFAFIQRAAEAAPTSHISRLELVSGPEREQTVVEWNDTAADFDTGATVHSLIEATTRQSPDAIAAQFEDPQLTYAELNARANKLAHHLRAQGVNAGDLVGLSVVRSAEMLVGVLAIMKAGAAYLPLDPDYPIDRLKFILADAKANLLVTETAFLERWSSFGGSIVAIDRDKESIAANSDSNPVVDVRPQDLAYTIHTSGSTGMPKGVQVRHRNVVNFLTSMQSKPGLTSDDTLMAVTTLSFDIAVLELYLPLIVGGKVLIAGPEIQADGQLLAKTLDAEGVTVMQATPASWKLLLSAGWEGQSSLRVLCGGEELTRDLAELLLPRCAEVWNMYGPTETTVWSAVKQVTTGSGPVPIGDPVANTQIYVLD